MGLDKYVFVFCTLFFVEIVVSQVNYFCKDSDLIYHTPTNFRYGSVADVFLTYQEMLDELDRMYALYPDLITEKLPIGDFRTEGTPNDSISPAIGNNPIYWLKISKNAAVDEDEPEVLFDSRIHGHEWPITMHNIYFMWYLLDNYGKDETVTGILDNTELYFIPVLNPDGALYSEFNFFKYGDLIYGRKNRKNATTNREGVDINRNFDYYFNGDPNQSTWGTGDDPSLLVDPLSYSYAGKSAFSEVESKAYRWFVEQRQFLINVTAHSSYGSSLTTNVYYPFFIENSEIEHINIYDNILYEACKTSNCYFREGKGIFNLGGSLPDFTYGTVNSHSPILSFATEVPSSGNFYVSRERLDSVSKQYLPFKLSISKMALNQVTVFDNQPAFLGNSLNTKIDIRVKKLGFGRGNTKIKIEGVTHNISSSQEITVPDLNQLEEVDVSIPIKLSPQIYIGDEVRFKIVTDNGFFKESYIFSKYFGEAQTLSIDSFDVIETNFKIIGDTIWSSNSNDYFSPPNSILGQTQRDSISFLMGKQPFDLTNGNKAIINFKTKYKTSSERSVLTFEISEDQENWQPLCGSLNRLNDFEEYRDTPTYYNNLPNWQLEQIDLTDFIGKIIYYRFAFNPKPYFSTETFLLDDLTLKTLNNIDEQDDETKFIVFPNPVDNVLKIKTTQRYFSVYLFDTLGRKLYELENTSFNQDLNMETFSQGTYFLRIDDGGDSICFTIVKS